MDIYKYAQGLKEVMGQSIGLSDGTKMLYNLADYVTRRQWNKSSFPKNEEPVLVIVERGHPGKEASRDVIRAFYEDGTLPEGLSNYFWDVSDDANVPAGWYELTDYGDGSYEVSDQVIGWQPLPDPWEE